MAGLIYNTMKESVYLLRANPALTTNIKLVCDSSYNLYLESYSANKELSDNKYKKVLISSDSFISERIANFFKDLPSNLAFEVKNTVKSDAIQKDLNLQYDDTYYSGMRIVEDTRYTEEFQYNTTLKIEPNNLPKWFFIFREDGSGLRKRPGFTPSILKVIKAFDLSKGTNIGKLFQKNYIDDDVLPLSPFELNLKKFEFSKWNGYDYKSGGSVSKSIFLEDYMRNSTTHYEMEKFITSQFQKNEVVSSNYLNVSFLFDDTASGVFETGIDYNIETDYKFMNEDIYNGDFKINSDLILDATYNNLFRVTSEKSYRKRWTINSYFGFYLKDLVYVKKISPTIPVALNLDGISVFNNEFIVTGSSLLTTGIIPAMPLLSTWDDNKVYHIKIKETYYLLDRYEEPIFDNVGTLINTITHYNIISDVTFNETEEGLLSDLIADYDKTIKIVWDSSESAPFITYQDNIPFKFDYDSKITVENSLFLLVKIYDKYYNVVYTDGDNLTRTCKIVTDWYLTCDGNKFIRKYDSNKTEEIFTQILNKDENIPYFEFYIPQFVPIADWDFARDNTGYANIEYDKFGDVNKMRPFLKEVDILDLSKPKDYYEERNYQILTKNPLLLYTIFFPTLDINRSYPEFYGDSFILPMASEYAATGDLYMLDKQNNISDIWNINQSISKWGYLNGIGNASYPYKINNDILNSGIYNFSPNPFTVRSDSNEFSLDWFYTFGIPHVREDLSADAVEIHGAILDIYFRTLNIDLIRQYQVYFFNGFTNYLDYIKFDLDYYKNPDSHFNLFGYFLNLPVNIGAIEDDTLSERIYKYYVKRTSQFSKGDGYNGPSVFFKGLKAYAEYVKLNNPNLPINMDQKDKVTYIPANDLEGYEFSVIFINRETIDATLHGKAGIDVTVNKIHKNILITIYVWTPFNCYTSLDFRSRDEVYDEEFVYYTVIETSEKIATEITPATLKLSTIYKILNDSLTTYPEFSCGIQYNIIEPIVEYTINDNGVGLAFDTTTSEYVAGIDGFYITLRLDGFFDIKQGDWVYLEFLSLPAFVALSRNYKVRSILNDKITIELDNSAATFGTLPFTLSINFLKKITKEKSLIPFKLRCVFPEEIKVDTTINTVVQDSSAPIIPDNKLSYINKVLINDIKTASDGIVENVWNNNPILRKMQKSSTENELTYKQLDNLPIIYRYSGEYEPVLNEISLFNKLELVECGINTNVITPSYQPSYILNLFYTFYAKQIVPGGPFKLIIELIGHSTNGLLEESNIFKPNDMLYLNFSTKLTTNINRIYDFGVYNTFYKIANKFVQIDSILGTYELTSTQISDLAALTPSVVIPEYPASSGNYPHKVYIIETNLEFDAYDSLYDPNYDVDGHAEYKYINGNAFKLLRNNIMFDTDLKDFGINKNIIIGKYTPDAISPLKSSNAIYDEKNKFAMDDEHGVTIIDKNIFTSSWDYSFYYKTVKNKFNS